MNDKAGTNNPNCPDDPGVICEVFRAKAQEWYDWALAAEQRFGECKCGPRDFTIPPPPSCADASSFEDVCELFNDWASQFSVWAEGFGPAVDACFDDWELSEPVPKVPPWACPDTSQPLCQRIKKYFSDLQKWGWDVRYPLMEICDPGTPTDVPPPPDPPF